MKAVQTAPCASSKIARQDRPSGFLPLLTLALLLSACGGGGGGIESTPTPPVSPPPPPPPPPPTPPPPPPGPLGLTGGPFITVAAEFDGISGEWPNGTTSNVRVGTDLVTITHSASDDSYTISLPAYGSGKLAFDGGSGSFEDSTAWLSYYATNYKLIDGGIERPVIVALKYPPQSGLTYTSSGSWSSNGDQGPRRQGLFAYGLPTAAGTMPISGTASYVANVDGYTRTNNFIWGSADFQFDFGAGSLAGGMTLQADDGWDIVPLGRFSFIETVYGSGSTSFSGRLTVPESTDKGSFAGRFTGPGGVELLGSFQTPAWHPFYKRWEDITGVFAGKRQ